MLLELLGDDMSDESSESGARHNLRDALVGVWRTLTIAALIGIGGAMWTMVGTVNDLTNSAKQAGSDIRELKTSMSTAQSALASVQTSLARTQVTIEDGIRQVQADQARRIAALEDRSQRQGDLLADARAAIARLKEQIDAARGPRGAP